MNVLIINAFGDNQKGKKNFDEFVSVIKKGFKKMTDKSNMDIVYILKDYNNFDEYIDDYYDAVLSNKPQHTLKRNFHKIDFVFIDGEEKFLPWKKQSSKIQKIIKMSEENKTILFAAGVAFQILIFFLATNFSNDFNIVNSNGEVLSIEDINSIPKDFLTNLKKNDYFLDYVTGDLYEYKPKSGEWVPIMNTGLHKTIVAEKYMYRGKFVLHNTSNTSYRPKSVSNVISSINTEIKTRTIKQYNYHYILKDMPNEFVVNSTLTWFSHNFNLRRKELQYKIIATSEKGPMIVEHGNSLGVTFHIMEKFSDTVKILENFITQKFLNVQEKGFLNNKIDVMKSNNTEANVDSFTSSLGYGANLKLDLTNIVDKGHVEQFLKKTKLELDRQKEYLEITAAKNNETSRDSNSVLKERPTTTSLVNSSRPFYNLKLTNKLGQNVGYNYNKRDMVFVEQNSVNSRPVTAKKMNVNLPTNRPGSPFKETNSFAFYLGSMSFKSQDNLNKNESCVNINNNSPLSPSKEPRKSKQNEQHKEKLNIDHNLEARNISSVDDLKKFVEEYEYGSDEYKNFVEVNKLDEAKMIEFYKLNRRHLTNKLVEEYKKYDDEMNKLSNVKIYNSKTNKMAEGKSSNVSQSSFRKSIQSKQSMIKEGQNLSNKDTDNVNIFSIMFPYNREEEFPKPVTRHIFGSGLDTDREGKDIVKVDMQKKSTNNYVQKFKQFEKDLDTFASKPYIRCSSPYVTEDEYKRREFLDSKNKWMGNKDFSRVFGKKTTNLKIMPSIMANGSPPSSIQHQYREVDRSKWITKKNFRL